MPEPLPQRADAMDAAKTARLLALSGRADPDTAAGQDAAEPEPVQAPPAAAPPFGSADAGKGASPAPSDLRSRIRAAEQTGDVAESIRLKNLQILDAIHGHRRT